MRALSAFIVLGIIFLAGATSIGLFLFNLGFFDN